MKIFTLRSYTNTIILFGLLLCNALYESELGGIGSIFNTIGFLFALVFISINMRFNRFLSLVFAVPLVFLLLSTMVNADALHAGSYNTALAISAGYILLTLKNPPLNRILMKRLIMVYLITALTLSLHYYSISLADRNIYKLIANSNFNMNPNGASLFFFTCIALSLVFVRRLMWVFVAAFSVLVLTTGSRSGFISSALLIMGFTLLNKNNKKRLFNWNFLFSREIRRKLLAFALIAVSIYTLLPDSFSYLQNRIEGGSLFDFHSKGGGGRDEIWEAILDKSLTSVTTVVFGTGPATASGVTDQGSHSSYVEAIGSIGWPFLIFTLFAVFNLFLYHKKHGQRDFILFGIVILIYGASSTELFHGLSSIWMTFIFLSLFYRSTGSDQMLVRSNCVDNYC